MQRKKITYKLFHQLALAALALLFAVISFALPYAQANPFHTHSIQKLSKENHSSKQENNNSQENDSQENESECFSLKEYLSDSNFWQQPVAFALVHAPDVSHDTYLAFHGEQLVPPPDVC